MSQLQLKFAFSCPKWLQPWVPEPWVEWVPAIFFLLAFVACIALVWRLYARIRGLVDRKSQATFLGLRFMAVAILLLFLFRPEVSYLQSSRERPFLVIMADVSRSMSIKDHPDMPARLAQVKSVIHHPPKAMKALFEVFEPRLFAFDVGSRELPLDEVSSLEPEGEGTFITRSLEASASAVEARRLGGILLFTDGADNSAGKPEEELRNLNTPVYAIGVGKVFDQKSEVRDIRLTDIEAPKVVTVNQMCQVHAYVEAYGFQDKMATVSMLRDDEPLAEAKVVLDGAPGPQKVTLSYSPSEVGRFHYSLRIKPFPSEQIEENNQRPFQWEVKDSPIKILYVEGKPRPEFKFLKRCLSRHESTQVLSLLRVGEGQFLQQGHIDGVEELLGFPQDKETLDRFDVVIFGSIGREHFSSLQLENVRAAIAEGAGFLMLGGYESFGAGAYAGTPVADLLPVRLGGEDIGQIKEQFVPVLTREGASHPVFSGIGEFFATPDRQAEHELPALSGCNRTLSPKPGAATLAVYPKVESEGAPATVVAVNHFGRGRTMAFTADSTWQWYLKLRGLGQESPYVRFWVQACRWLAGKRIEEGTDEAGLSVHLEEDMIDAGADAVLRAQAYDRQGLLTPMARVAAAISGPTKETYHITLPFLPGSRGVYECSFRPPVPGKYEMEVKAELDGEPLGKPVTLELAVNQPRRELEDLSLNENLLRRIAASTGGRYVTLGRISELAESLRSGEHSRMAYRHYALWNAPWLFVAFIVLQTLEWALRKKRHLA